MRRQLEMGDILNDIAALIADGHEKKAADEVLNLLKAKVPRAHTAQVAFLLARCGMPTKGLKLLHPMVRTNGRARYSPSDEEKVIYAICLIRLGATQEGLTLLNEVSPEKVPSARLYSGIALLTQWNYRLAMPIFSEYVASTTLTPYEKAVGKLNLAACFVHEHFHDDALAILESLLVDTNKNGWIKLRGNTHELLAQNAVFAREWKEAEDLIKRAEHDLSEIADVDSYYVQKWKCILSVGRSGANPASLRALRELKIKAAEKRHWETVRDCDRAQAIESKDEDLFRHLYFGTPYKSYRDWMLKDFGGRPLLDDPYVLTLGNSKDLTRVMDLSTGIWKAGQEPLAQGSLIHRILVVLSSDFYRPFRLAPLHAQLHPDVFFSPVSATHMIHEGIHRCRKFLKSNRIPLEIEQVSGQYRLVSKTGVSLRVYRYRRVVNPKVELVEKMRAEWPEGEFTVGDVVNLLGLSRRSAQRALQTAIEEGILIRSGKASATKYQVAITARSSKAA